MNHPLSHLDVENNRWPAARAQGTSESSHRLSHERRVEAGEGEMSQPAVVFRTDGIHATDRIWPNCRVHGVVDATVQQLCSAGCMVSSPFEISMPFS